jgi:hypothetical protein
MTVTMKAAVVGCVVFLVFSAAWIQYFLRPGLNKAIGEGAYRATFGPWFWCLAVGVGLVSAGLYMMVRR